MDRKIVVKSACKYLKQYLYLWYRKRLEKGWTMTFEEHVYKTKAFTAPTGNLLSLEEALCVSAVGFPPVSRRQKLSIYKAYTETYAMDKLRHFKSAFGQSFPINEATNLAIPST